MNLIKIGTFKLRQAYADYLYRKSIDYQLLRSLPKRTGEIGFLIGNGPSVRIEDLEKLSGRTAFCCNRFYMAYSMMSFRPTFTFCADRQVIDDFGHDIADNSEGEVVFVNKTNPEIPNSIWLPLASRRRLVFKKSRISHVTTGGGTLFTAMQLGYFLGIRKFVLYGVDHSFKFDKVEASNDFYRSASGDNNHFIKGYRSGKKWCPPEMKLIEDSFMYADWYLRKRNGFVLNATRGGRLEALERVDFGASIQF